MIRTVAFDSSGDTRDSWLPSMLLLSSHLRRDCSSAPRG
jgi:hypothetical protein